MPERDRRALYLHPSDGVNAAPSSVEVDARRFSLVTEFAVLPPSAFAAVVERMCAWRVPQGEFYESERLAFDRLYAAIRVFLEK